MNSHIKHTIDNLIREHCVSIGNEYFCEVNDLDKEEVESLLKTLWQEDEFFQDKVRDYMHNLLQLRIGFVQSQDNYEKGLVPTVNRTNGETSWRYVGN